jgi:cell wall-associated NlpC family hydrolase
MTWTRARFDDIWQEIQPGDVIAFGGTGGFAGVIKWATLGTVNHVAIVLPSVPSEDGTSQEEDSRQQLTTCTSGPSRAVPSCR